MDFKFEELLKWYCYLGVLFIVNWYWLKRLSGMNEMKSHWLNATLPEPMLAISQKTPQPPVTEISLNITYLNLRLNHQEPISNYPDDLCVCITVPISHGIYKWNGNCFQITMYIFSIYCQWWQASWGQRKHITILRRNASKVFTYQVVFKLT